MKYQQPSFTLPTSNGKVTDVDYEIAVGIRCFDCGQRKGTFHDCRTNKRRIDIIGYLLSHPMVPYRVVAETFGVSWQRVQQIAKRNKFAPRPKGRYKL